MTCCRNILSTPPSPCSESALLLRWRDLLLESDPDVIIGYNTTNFDLPYIFERAQVREGTKGRSRQVRLPALPSFSSRKGLGTHLPPGGPTGAGRQGFEP